MRRRNGESSLPNRQEDASRPDATVEIRSYRRVFAPERRLYRIDRLRLNPAGVPLRGIVYFLALLGAGLAFGALPLLGVALRVVPWYLRDGLVPALGAALLTLIWVDGRPSHVTALALICFQARCRHSAGLRLRRASAMRWRPGELPVLTHSSPRRGSP
jgi:hypothetical protein